MKQQKQLRAGLVAIFAAAAAVGVSGCWLAAAQLAPLAASAAEDVGGGAIELAAGIGASTHVEATQAKKAADARESAMTSGDTCNQLTVEVPGVIELRRSASGAPEYRELQISDSLDQPQWAPVADTEATADGWQPAVNFLQMNFSPPLGAVVPEKASTFLAYAPSGLVTAADSDRLTAMTSNFGKPIGTFMWKGQYYHYVVTSTLPCFPPPPQRIAADTLAQPGL
ncbi:MAG: hypothetical protein ACREQH_06245 [Candidatus Binatus sp.]